MKMSESTYKTELARQTEILHKAVEQALNDEAAKFETPMLNAVMGALIASIAVSLGSVSDHRTRKALRKLMDEELSRQVARQVASGPNPAKTMIIDRGMH